jgi:hypothetical protein
MTQQRVCRAEQVVDDLAADHEMRHQREQRYRHQQIGVELAEHEIADAAEMALGRKEDGGGEQHQAGEHRDAGEQHQHQADEDQRKQHGPIRCQRFGADR